MASTDSRGHIRIPDLLLVELRERCEKGVECETVKAIEEVLSVELDGDRMTVEEWREYREPTERGN